MSYRTFKVRAFQIRLNPDSLEYIRLQMRIGKSMSNDMLLQTLKSEVVYYIF